MFAADLNLRPGQVAAKFHAMPDSLPVLSPAELSRYSRHILLDEIGVEGQRRLAAARVLVIGAGGLGSPAALYLAAAGIGTLGIADLDEVEEHNLQRQLLHDSASIGESKVTSAARRLRASNPHLRVIEHREGITAENAAQIFDGYDVIVDGTDNFAARYLNNDAAFFARKPLVFGSVYKFEGQVAVFHSVAGGPCYRCLFPEPPASGSIPGCSEVGVLGALCGVVGSLQSLETIKLITAIGEPLIGRLLTYDALAQRFQTFAFTRNASCPLCGTTPSIYTLNAATFSAGETPAKFHDATKFGAIPLEISVAEAKRRLDAGATRTVLVDVREPWETAICRVTPSELIPMRQIPERMEMLPKDRHLLILCHHGARSLNVTHFLRARGFPAVSNVSGGITAWAEQIEPSMTRY